MTTYYVSSVDGSDSDAGTSWALAKATLGAGIALATANGDVVKVDRYHAEALTSNTTYAIQNNISIICVDRSASDAPTAQGASYGLDAITGTSYYAVFTGAYNYYIYGLTIKVGADSISFAGTNNSSATVEQCYLRTASLISISGANAQGGVQFINCTFYAGGVNFYIAPSGTAEFVDCTLSASGSSPTYLFKFIVDDPRGSNAECEGCDWSHCGSNYLASDTLIGNGRLVMSRCKLGTNFVALPTLTRNHPYAINIWLYDCSSGDQHYHLAHYNPLGSVVMDTSTYVNDNIADTDLSWKVTTTANASYNVPYITPWIDVYNADVSTSITPYIEGLRASETDSDANTTAQNDEIWGVLSYKGTSGSTIATAVRDRMQVLGTPADQTSSKATTDWTISTSNDAYKSTFKLAAPSAFTPAETGHIRGRVVVAIPSKTFFIDPQIRGLA